MPAKPRTGQDVTAGQEPQTRTRRLRSSGGDPTIKNPALIVPVKDPLPGENAPLAYDPGRTYPITEQEALGVIRRRRRAELTRRGASKAEINKLLPTSIARWTDAKEAVTMRMQPRLVALAAAHAEAEGTHLAALLDELLTEHILKAPRNPDDVEASQARLEAATVRLDRFEQRLATKAGTYETLEKELARIRAALSSDGGGPAS